MVVPIEQRFNAAVNVIRSLPKNGSYQPSNNLLLRFYAYFKQATLGPCKQQRPPFWNVVDKAKWDAYNALGNMSSDRAMELYVDELKKIIETMSYTDNVAEFMGSVSQLNAIDIEDLEAVAPDAIKTVRSRPNSPFASRESSPVRVDERSAGLPDEIHHADEFTSAAEYSDDEYIDTVENDPDEHRTNRSHQASSNGYGVYTANHTPPASNGTALSANVEPALHQMLCCVEAMRVDLQLINNRINIVEMSLTDVRQQQQQMQHIGKQETGCSSAGGRIIHSLHGVPSWWPFRGITPVWFVLLAFVWPMLARRLLVLLFLVRGTNARRR